MWAVKASPGPHSGLKSIPLLLVIRDVLKLANSSREVKKILHDGNILVDGVLRRDYKFPVGVFDVITIPKIGQSYRAFLDGKQRLSLVKISDPDVKLCKITDKTIIKGGNTQLNLHDGSNIVSDECSYHPSDSVILSLPGRKVVKHLTYKTGSLALIIGGAHSGELATIENIRKTRSAMPNIISLHSSYDFETVEDYVYVIGKTTPEIETQNEGDVVE